MDMNLRQILVILLILAAIVLVVVLIMLAVQLIQTVKKANTVLDDANRITTVAAEKAEALDGVIDEASDMMLGVIDTVRGNTSAISKVVGLGQGISSAKSVADKLRSKKEEVHSERARARKARRRTRI